MPRFRDSRISPFLISSSMATIICQPCIDTKDTACVDVCPVDCIHPAQRRARLRDREDALLIHPDECIDCGACVPARPVEAIHPLEDTPGAVDLVHLKNRAYFDGQS